jgi:hypothetical protein
MPGCLFHQKHMLYGLGFGLTNSVYFDCFVVILGLIPWVLFRKLLPTVFFFVGVLKVIEATVEALFAWVSTPLLLVVPTRS